MFYLIFVFQYKILRSTSSLLGFWVVNILAFGLVVVSSQTFKIHSKTLKKELHCFQWNKQKKKQKTNMIKISIRVLSCLSTVGFLIGVFCRSVITKTLGKINCLLLLSKNTISPPPLCLSLCWITAFGIRRCPAESSCYSDHHSVRCQRQHSDLLQRFL